MDIQVWLVVSFHLIVFLIITIRIVGHAYSGYHYRYIIIIHLSKHQIYTHTHSLSLSLTDESEQQWYVLFIMTNLIVRWKFDFPNARPCLTTASFPIDNTITLFHCYKRNQDAISIFKESKHVICKGSLWHNERNECFYFVVSRNKHTVMQQRFNFVGDHIQWQ